jgi:parvulin-like peptidyl-prolyl isomerase
VHRPPFSQQIIGCCLALCAAAGCGAPIPDDAVATYDGGSVTAAEAERFLAWFDTRRLRTEAAVTDSEAVSELLEELAFRKILAEQAGDGPEAQAPLYLDARGSLLVEYYIERTGKRSHEITDEEALAFYNEHLDDRFTAPESITFQHIFLRADRHSAAELAELQQTILGQLADGVPFAELAARYSESDSVTRDGVVGPVFRGRMDPVFEEQVYRLAPGRPAVVRTAHGSHVVVVTERRPREVETFEAVKRQIVHAIMDRRNEAEKNELLAGLRERYGVEDRSGDRTLGPDDVVIRVKDRTMTRQDLDSYLAFWMSLPNRVDVGGAGLRERAADELITANLLYLDAVDSGLDQEPEFLDRWAMQRLRRDSGRGAQQALEQWAREVGEDEVLAYYRDNQSRFAVPQRFDASYLYMPLGGAAPFELQQRLEQLAAFAQQERSDPEAFRRRCAEAGATYSDMGWVTPIEAARIGPEFQRRLLSMTGPGTTDAFKDEAGLYVIQVRGVEPRRPMVPPEDMELIRGRYVQLRQGEILSELRQRLLESRSFTILSTDVFSAGGEGQ